ncbi:MAG TPA: UDP-N-acetylmuramate dehydrogenase [Edaphocola sp.]|nr:UDP-N-acetylmuramate dehydrogenase [Edaphocola sp.]
MINIIENQSLDKLNTFGMKSTAPYFSIIKEEQDCVLLKENTPGDFPILVLGGGSNMLFIHELKYWVIKNEIKGIKLLREDKEYGWFKVGAGEIWHDFVLNTIEKGFSGIENLSLIPGTVGAAPIQNIGAYGVEVKQSIEKVHYWDLENKVFKSFNNQECKFGYRDSVFKRHLKGKFIITAVEFKLSKTPKVNVSYGNIKDELEKIGITNPTTKDISNAVIAIRQAKLPDPKVVGNAGSFFKNPEVENDVFNTIKSTNPNVPGYVITSNITKIPAAWLIEQCGWKGFREGDYGVHPKQPLVLVNYGNANGQQIFNLSEKIIQSVKQKFGISLEREVQMI